MSIHVDFSFSIKFLFFFAFFLFFELDWSCYRINVFDHLSNTIITFEYFNSAFNNSFHCVVVMEIAIFFDKEVKWNTGTTIRNEWVFIFIFLLSSLRVDFLSNIDFLFVCFRIPKPNILDLFFKCFHVVFCFKFIRFNVFFF